MILKTPGIKPDTDPTKPPPKGYHRIGACLQDKSTPGSNDWHFYRQLPDRTWVHKRGYRAVEDVDASGKPITDPQKADRNYHEGNYDAWIGTYLAPSDPKKR
jgi:hypothetical protein